MTDANMQSIEPSAGQTRPESKRARVRRIVFEPLERDGLRPNPKVRALKEEGAHRAWLDRLADDMGHMGDESLEALHDTIRYNTVGDGKTSGRRRSARGCWPSRIDILDWANAIEKFPMDKVPGLKGWFASVEGPKALENDMALETFDWIRRHKRPPFRYRDKQSIREAATDRRREIDLARERLKRGPDAACEALVQRYDYRLNNVRAIIRKFRGDKGMIPGLADEGADR